MRLFFRCYKKAYKPLEQLRNAEMAEKILTKLNIRIYQHIEMEGIIYVWEECGMIGSWNNPKLDIERKVNAQKDLFLSVNSQTK